MSRHLARYARAAWRGSLHFLTHHGLVYSSAIAFNLLLSSVPILFLAFAATAMVIGSNDLPYAQLSELLKEAFPYGAQVLVPNLKNLVQSSTTFGLAGTALLFFTSFSATDAVHKSLSVMLDKPDDQHFGRSALFHVALVLTLTVLTGAAILTPTIWRGIAFLFSTLPEQLDSLILLMHYLFSTLVLPALIFLMGVLSYRYLSPSGGVRWIDAIAGSLLFTAMATGIKFGFIFYVAKFSRLSIIYGSLFGIVSFIMVAYLFAAAYLLSASIIGSLERDRERV
jgi:uncharacterized BrkB/YihY/UPF0761 family membrane protein